MQNWDRTYKLIAAPPNGEGFTVGEESDPMPIRINFNIEKADTETPNTSRISLWNLSPKNIDVLNDKDCKIILYAGYRDKVELAFIGEVVFATTLPDGADRETKIEVSDGRLALRDTYVSLSYAGSINTRQIISDTVAQMGIPLTISHNAEFCDYPNGFSFVGPARVAMDKGCDSTNLQWHIYNEIMCVKKSRDTLDREVYVLSSETGLVGIPKRIIYSEDGYGVGEQPGWEVMYLLNAAIGISDFVKVVSREVTGFFHVKWVEMVGDNHQGDWKCTAKLIYV